MQIARSLRRPVKCILERRDDMALTGTRHPFLGRYKVAVDTVSHKVRAYELHLYANAGHTRDVSHIVMSRFLR